MGSACNQVRRRYPNGCKKNAGGELTSMAMLLARDVSLGQKPKYSLRAEVFRSAPNASMSGLGQKLKSSMRVYVFRSAPNNGHRATTAACPSCANKRHCDAKISSSQKH